MLSKNLRQVESHYAHAWNKQYDESKLCISSWVGKEKACSWWTPELTRLKIFTANFRHVPRVLLAGKRDSSCSKTRSLWNLSNHDDDDDHNVTTLHIWQWKTLVLHALHERFSAHFAADLVQSTMWNDLFRWYVSNMSVWRQMLSIFFEPKIADTN